MLCWKRLWASSLLNATPKKQVCRKRPKLGWLIWNTGLCQWHSSGKKIETVRLMGVGLRFPVSAQNITIHSKKRRILLMSQNLREAGCLKSCFILTVQVKFAWLVRLWPPSWQFMTLLYSSYRSILLWTLTYHFILLLDSPWRMDFFETWWKISYIVSTHLIFYACSFPGDFMSVTCEIKIGTSSRGLLYVAAIKVKHKEWSEVNEWS